MTSLFPSLILICAIAAPFEEVPALPSLEQSLLKENPEALAKSVREEGDPNRGALIFFQPYLSCTKCHATSDSQENALGPNLAKLGKDTTDAYLIESVLKPSSVVKKGFETVSIATVDGKTFTGLLAEDRPDSVALRDPAQDGKSIVILKADIDARKDNGPSIMPAGLVNALTSRRQFLDLVSYLRAIADGGPERAKELRPDPSQVAGLVLPDYESKIDHAGMIAELGPENLQRGEAIYNRVCINCHGTKDKPGSLPTSLKFASGKFKNGGDPHSLYRTLTQGYGQMPPQTWMVPSQKYDVIHYLRETFLKDDNPTQYAAVDTNYLNRLPKGTTRGPEPSTIEPWSAMDYGPSLSATYEISNDESNFAHKGVAIRLDAGPGGVSRGRHWAVFEHDTMRMASVWSGDGFIDWNSINFNGQHGVHPKIVSQVEYANPNTPGWANPETGTFDDPRILGRDDRHYGPLPRSWAHFQGEYRHGDRVILAYGIGTTNVLESPTIETGGGTPVFGRAFEIGPRDKAMTLQVARGPKGKLQTIANGETSLAYLGGDSGIIAGVFPAVTGISWSSTPDGDLRLTIPAGAEPLRFTLKLARVPSGTDAKALPSLLASSPAIALGELTRGGPSRWPEVLKTPVTKGLDDGAFAVDFFGLPENNPWLCQLRLTGFDFLDGGNEAAVCTWDGDVWRVGGLGGSTGELTWKRIASGMFQPLGLKVHDGKIFVTCRDQITILRDINHDGETDFYESFNSDHQVTEHFHEFAMDLQTDAAGNFYYAKAARHGKVAVVPQHGTLLKVSPDGLRTEILATGFRAPNGVCVNGDGTFFMTDQEGFWHPKNRINHVKVGGFYGNMWGYHNVTDPSDSAMQQPLCWITNAFDRSPAEILRVTGNAWGPLKGSLLNLSYGNGKIFVVPTETIGGQMQGGMCALPFPHLPTGVMRGRFGPTDGQLYALGMVGWASDRTVPGGFYRIRATGKPMFLPVGLHASKSTLKITFTEPLNAALANDVSRYALKTWSLKRSAKYGSEHYDEKPLKVAAASLSEDGKTVTLTLPDLRPTWSMEIKYSLKGASGEAFEGTIHNTIHRLGE